MSERLGKAERKDRLTSLLRDRHARAKDQKDFTAASLASEAGVSPVWFYKLVGDRFIELRATLPGPIISGETLVAKLRKEVRRLRSRVRELKAKYEASIKEKLAGAISHIELLETENRMLRERVAYLEKCLIIDKVDISSGSEGGDEDSSTE